MYTVGDTQIIGMSATLNNIGDLQKFLDADIYTNDFRPVSFTVCINYEYNNVIIIYFVILTFPIHL